MHGTNRIVRAALGSVGVLFVGQIGLEDGFEHDDGCHLRDPVLDGRYAQRSLLPVRFGDVHPPHGLRLVGFAFEFFRQSIQPRSQPRGLDLLEGLPVHARAAAMGATALIRKGQHVPAINFVVEAVETKRWICLRFGLQ
jgi:hypothetical protein